MKCFFKFSSIFLILVSFLGCKPDVEVEVKTGSIQGRVVYDNGNVKDYSGIQVTLFSTNGLMATDYCISRGISANARSVESTQITNESGEYFFENVPEGVYTIYASSNSSTKKAVATNIVVRASEIVTAEDLGLTATGSIRGTISFADTTADFLGFDVFIAGTSFIAKVDNYGYFEISNIPAGTGYVLCLQKGDKTKIIEENVEVRPNESPYIWETFELHEWETNAFNWLGSFEIAPENPKKYEAYYNSLDGCSYIYNGINWELLAKAGTDGEDGKDGVNGKDGVIGKDGEKGDSIDFLGSYPNAGYIYDPQYLDVYFNTTEGQSYIYDGSSWTLLVQKGDTGTDGEDGEDGISINWRGDFASSEEISDPKHLDAYFNTADGCSYIYNGWMWTTLAQSGKSINWKGAFSSTDYIYNPQYLDVYFNTADGCSYIYIDDTWKLLAQKGTDGQGLNWLGSYSSSEFIYNPQYLDAYYNTTDGCSYIYTSDGLWEKFTQDGKEINWRGDYEDSTQISDPQYLDAYFNTTDGCSYIYTYDRTWKLLAKKGDKGNDGSTIRWCGSHNNSNEIENPQFLWAYYNITDGCSYIYDGNAWQLFARKGSDGATGSGDGGIRWRGDFIDASEVTDPVALDAFFNITTGSSYIYNGSEWKMLAQAGEDGIDGIDGTNGKDGLSINWLGSKTCHEDIQSPKKLDAYWNTTENCAYIYNGYSWTVLVKGPGSEGTGSLDPTNSTADAEIVGTTLLSWKVSNPEGAIRIPNGVTDIAEGVFNDKDRITRVIIPSTVVTIGKQAFYDCDGLTSVEFLGSGLETIGASAFKSCDNLANITLPDSLKAIDTEAFYGCKKLTTVKIPDSVILLGSEAYYCCYMLRTLTIGSGVTQLKFKTFSSCDALVSVTIPDSVKSINDTVFADCNNLAMLSGVSGKWELNGVRAGSTSNLTIADLKYSNYNYSSTWTRVD